MVKSFTFKSDSQSIGSTTATMEELQQDYFPPLTKGTFVRELDWA
jgi:hypothetical protein